MHADTPVEECSLEETARLLSDSGYSHLIQKCVLFNANLHWYIVLNFIKISAQVTQFMLKAP